MGCLLEVPQIWAGPSRLGVFKSWVFHPVLNGEHKVYDLCEYLPLPQDIAHVKYQYPPV